MSETSQATTELTDADLIEQVRSGRLDAYGELFARHRDAAQRLARNLVSGPDADDLVAESFSRVLTALQNGNGPHEFFRAYLLTSLRRLHIDRIRAAKRVKTTADEAELDRAVAFVDPAEMKFEQSTAAAAFASLPERWQLVLWHLDVEGQKPADVAPLLGMSANSVSALAYRAREGLRTAYLQGHLAPALDDECRRTTPMLAQHVRGKLSKRDAVQVEAHLDDCARCSGLYAELAEVNNHLAGLLAPAALGAAAAGYLASSGSTAAVGLFAQLADTLGRPFGWASAGSSAGASTGVVVTVVTALALAGGAVAVTQLAGEDSPALTQSAQAGPSRAPAPTARPAVETASPPRQPRASLAPAESAAPALPAAPVPPAPTTGPRPQTTPTPQPTRSAPPIRIPVPVPTPAVTPSPVPSPTPSTPPTLGPTTTDYGVSVTGFAKESPSPQRRVSIAFSADGETPRGNALTVSVTVSGADQLPVPYHGGIPAGWVCTEPAVGEAIEAMTCTRDQTGASVPPLEFSMRGYTPLVTVSISAATNADPSPGNDSAEERAPFWDQMP